MLVKTMLPLPYPRTLSLATFSFNRSFSLVANRFAFSGLDRASKISLAPMDPLRCSKIEEAVGIFEGGEEGAEGPCQNKKLKISKCR